MTPALRLLVVILVAAWLGSLAVRPLYKPDEARYGEIAREMAQSGDWVTPRLNGFKYFEKPPLQYWASAAALKVFGKHDWTARLWTGVMALAGIGLVFQAGRQLFSPSAGLLAAAVLAGSPLYLLVGQVNTLDMGVTVFLSAAAFSFALAWHRDTPPSRRRLWMLAFWAACGMAVLSKGLIGIVLPCTAVGLYIVLRRDWPLVGRLEFLRGGALFAAIVAPWFICVALANREFLYFFFVQEHWLRYTTAIHQREGAAWFYVPVLAAGVAPWLLVVLAASAASLRGLGNRGFATEFFLFLWALTVFAFFSVSHSKLPAYILPMLPALALLAGSFLAREGRSGLLIAQSLLLAGGGIALASALPDSASFADWSGARFVAAYRPWLATAATVLLAAGVLGTAFASLGKSHHSAACIALGSVVAFLIAHAGHRVFGPTFSAAETVAAIRPVPSSEAQFFAVDSYDHSLPWALGRTVIMVRHTGELGKAVLSEPDRFIPDLPAFARQWTTAREAYAVFAVRDFDSLRNALALPMQEVARGPRYVVVRKP